MDHIQIPVDPTFHSRVVAASERLHVKEEVFLRLAVEDFLQRHETYSHELAEDEENWQEYKRTGEHVSETEMDILFEKTIKASKQRAGEA